MHWAQSICVMEPHSRNNAHPTPLHPPTHPPSYFALETSTVKVPAGEDQEKRFPVLYFVRGICVYCISDLCLCTCASLCLHLYYTSAHMQILPFDDHVSTAAYTTTP